LAEGSIPQLVGIREIAKFLGVSPQRASELAKSGSFPRPVTKLASGPVWLEASMRQFASDWKRVPGRPAAERGKGSLAGS
jgi:predicted DNA-binding transcriptional regulator AlpA